MEFETGVLQGGRLLAVREFLKKNELDPPEGTLGYTVNLLENDSILATGTVDGNLLKYLAVAPEAQGEGLSAVVISRLVEWAVAGGMTQLFLYTKPQNRKLFSGTGFYPVAETACVLLMENRRDGVKKFVASFPKPPCGKTVGAIVANCNPFTRGHLYLAEKAAQACDFLYFLVVAEDRSYFSAAQRLTLAQKNLAQLPNVAVCSTGAYLISSATFPAYFIKEKSRVTDFSTALDLKIFAECFAKPLGITKRFVGEEPFCEVTREYNRQMAQFLLEWGIEQVVIPRLEQEGVPISASRVRELLREGNAEQLRPLVTEITYHELCGGKDDE